MPPGMPPHAPRLTSTAAASLLSVIVALLASGLRIAAVAALDTAYEDRTQFAAVDTSALPPVIGMGRARRCLGR
jgi:hypothetical protein